MIDLQKIYEEILSEETKKIPENERVTIDNFCDENTTDIAESGEEEDNEGWSEEVKGILNDVMTQMDSFIYEMKNCTKGSYTNCKTNEELAKYLRSLTEQIDLAADQIGNL